MNSFVINTFIKIDDLIKLVREKKERDALYMVYVPEDTDDLAPGMEVYVGELPTFDDNDNEIMPPSVVSLGLEQGYRRDALQDVIDLAYKQKPTASIDEVIRCLNHYADHDDFLDLAP